jgi:hypothetical protein
VKRILKSDLDKFYTKPNIANILINKIDLNKYNLAVDPCCGDGAFYSQISIPKIGIDILPTINDPKIIKHDFLTWDYKSINESSNKVIVISNPPFGKQGSLAMKFIKRSCLFADTIAFILPISFVKDSVKNRIPINYHLIYEEILLDNSYLLDNEDYSVKCVFQIWEKRNYNRILIERINEIGFSYTKNKKESDLAIRRVGVYAGKAYVNTDKSEQSHYFIKLNDKLKKEKIINTLDSFTWDNFTIGPRSISKNELNRVLNKLCQ